MQAWENEIKCCQIEQLVISYVTPWTFPNVSGDAAPSCLSSQVM